MTETYKILSQDMAVNIEPLTGYYQANILYSVPSATQAAISTISVINSGTTTGSYKLAITKKEFNDKVIPTTVVPAVDSLAIVSGYGVSTSNDGLNWQYTSLKEKTPSYNLVKDMASGGNSVCFIAGYNNIIYTKDMKNFKNVYTPINDPRYIEYSNGRFFIMDYYSYTGAYSNDGLTWTLFSRPQGTSSSTYTLKMVYGNNILIPYYGYTNGSLNDTTIYSPDNGNTWNLVTLPTSGSSGSYSGTFANNKFYFIFNNKVAYSSDGVNWTSAATNITLSADFLLYGNGVFVTLGYDYNLKYSYDAISWYDTGFYGEPGATKYHNGVFIIKSPWNQQIYVSSDGITWTSSMYNGWGNDGGYIYTGKTLTYDVPDAQFITIDDSQTIIPTRSISSNEIQEVVGNITLSEGDQVRIYSESSDIIAQIYGVELS